MAGSTRVHIRDGSSGALLTDIDFGDIAPQAMQVVDSYNANTTPEIAILGTLKNGMVRVQVNDSDTGEAINSINYGERYLAVDMALLPDSNSNGVDELAVLGQRITGATRVQARDIVTDAATHVSFYGSKGPARNVAIVGDISANSEPEVAVDLEIAGTGQSRARMRDTDTNELLLNMSFGGTYTPVDFAAINDVSGDGIADLAGHGAQGGYGRNTRADQTQRYRNHAHQRVSRVN